MLRKLVYFLLLFFFIAPVISTGQKQYFNNICIDTRFHYGFLAPHHETLRYLQKGHIPSINFKISKSTSNLFPWSGLYRNPDIGLAYYYADLKWDDVLGNVNATYSFISFPINRNSIINSNYYVEMGLAFLSKHFDVDDNYYNIAIGSKTNFYFSTGVDLNIKLHKDLYFSTGASIKHFSNGAVVKPNKGINLLNANAGLKYYVNRTSNINNFTDIKFPKYFSILFIGNVGMKQIYPPGGDNFFISSSIIEALLDISPKKSIGLGIDLFYDGSIRSRMESGGYDSKDMFDNFRQGVHLGYNTHFGSLVFSFQVGTYFLVNWNDDDPIYSRLGMRYRNKRFIYNINLKTHYGRADYIEWGLGYILLQKERK